MAHSHLSSEIGLSSIMVPRLTVYCLSQPLHFQTRRVERKEYSLDSHSGHTGPSGHRSDAMKFKATSGSLKNRTVSIRVCGKSSFAFIVGRWYHEEPGESSMLLP